MNNREGAPLGVAGAELVRAITADLAGNDLELDSREVALVHTAARLADRLADLETILAADGLRIESATGVVKIHPAASEHRQTALAMAKVLDAIQLADDPGAARSPESLRKSRAAGRRWNQRDRTVAAAEARAAAGGVR